MRRCLLAFLILLGTSAATHAADETGQLVVVVTDENDKPLAGIQVLAWTAAVAHRGVTGADGRWSKAVLVGSYAIGVRGHERVGSESYDLEVRVGETTKVRFQMPPGVLFVGRVQGPDGKPVVGADVVVEVGGSFEGYGERTFNQPPWARDRTNAKGDFYVGGIPDGKVATIVVTAKGLQTTRMAVRALDGKIRPDPVIVSMGVGASVSGTITRPDGTPAKSADVFVIPTAWPKLLESPELWISSSDGQEIRALRGTADATGRYAIEGAEVGTEYLVKARMEGLPLSPASKPVTPRADMPAVTSDVTLLRGTTLSVSLRSPDGAVVTDAKVTVGTAMNAPELEAGNDEGCFVFEGLPSGRTALEVKAPGFLGHIRPVDLVAGKTQAIEITLDSGVRIRGVVRSEAGDPVAGLRVRAPFKTPNPVTGWNSFDSVESTTDAEGRFDLGPLRPGSYKLAVQSTSWKLTAKAKVTAPSQDVLLEVSELGTARIRFLSPNGSPFVGSVFVWRDVADTPGTRTGEYLEPQEGRLVLKGFSATPSRVTFQFDDFVTVERVITAPDGKPQDLGEIRLDPGVTVRGRIVLPSGEAAAGARVRLGERREITDQEGRFELAHVSKGPLVLSAKAEGLPRTFFTLEAASGSKDHKLELVEGTLVRIRIVDADGGAPVPHARVAIDIQVGKDWRDWGSGRADEQGAFEGRLPPGQIRFKPAGEADAEAILEVTLGAGKARDIVLEMPAK